METVQNKMTFCELFSKTFQTWKQLVFPLAGFQFLAYLPIFIASFYLAMHYPDIDFADLPTNALILSSSANILSWLLLFLVVGTFYKAAINACQNNPIIWSEILNTARKYWLRVIWTAIVLSLAIFLGFIALVIPAFIVIVNTSVLFPAMFVENLKMSPSWTRSKELVKGARWRILGYFIAFNLIVALPSIIAIAIEYFLEYSPGRDMMGRTYLSAELISLFTSSAFPIFLTHLYFTRREIKEEKAPIVLT